MADDVMTRAAPAVPAVPRVSGATADDWTVQATDAIVKVVGTAHDKITGPIQKVALYTVYGLLAALLGAGAAVLGTIMAFRFANNYLPDSVFGENHIWVIYGADGALLMLFGWIAWRKRKPRPTDE